MIATLKQVLPLRSEQDIVAARHLVRKLTTELKFSLVDQTKMITAASELARNTIVYGKGGEMVCEFLVEGARTGLKLRFVDQGPGIANLDLALKDGWTTGNGLGMGLSGSKRLVHEFRIVTEPGNGCEVTVIRWQ